MTVVYSTTYDSENLRSFIEAEEIRLGRSLNLDPIMVFNDVFYKLKKGLRGEGWTISEQSDSNFVFSIYDKDILVELINTTNGGLGNRISGMNIKGDVRMVEELLSYFNNYASLYGYQDKKIF